MKPGIRNAAAGASVLAVLTVLTACGGGDSGPVAPVTPPSPSPSGTYTVGGTVTGLSGPGLVLSVFYTYLHLAVPVSVVRTLPVSAAGTFTFDKVAGGTSYAVGVEAQPSSNTQYCSVANGSGTVATANVTNVAVNCGTGYTAGGTVSGLAVGSGLVLQVFARGYGRPDGASPPLYIVSNGTFTFDLVYPGNSTGTFVRITRQPASPIQRCVVQNAAISIQTANVTNIQVVCSQFSYVANAGDNTLSAYLVDAASGALAALGMPVATGTSPHAIVGTQDKKYLFVGNEGSNDISAFAVNSTSGALTAVPGSPFAAGTDPKALALLGSFLYVANAGSDTVSAFAVDTSTGSLTPLSPASFPTGKGPSSIAVNGQVIYVADNGGSNDVSAFSVDSSTGILTPLEGSPFPAGANPLSLALGAAGEFLYAANPGATNPSISGFSVDANSGALTPLTGSPFPVAVSHDIATDRTGAYLYVTEGTGVVGYGIDGTTGMLAPLTGFPVATGTGAHSVTFDPTNQFLYVANDGSGDVSGFRFDASTGGLTAITGSPFPTGDLPDFVTVF